MLAPPAADPIPGLSASRPLGGYGGALIGVFVFAAALWPAVLFPAAPVIHVEVGFRGVSQGGQPMPVLVTLQGDGTDRQLRLLLSGTPGSTLDLELPRQTTKRVFLYTEPDRGFGAGYPVLTVSDGDEVLHEEELKSDVLGLDRLVPIVGGASPTLTGVLTPALAPESLPEKPRGYAALHALFVYPGAWAKISPPALDALSIWVAGGGLVLGPLASRSVTLSLPDSHPFGPVRVRDRVDVGGVWLGVESACGGGHAWRQPEGRRPPRRTRLELWDRSVVARMTAPPERQWKVAAFREGAALPETVTVAAERRFGQGSIRFLAFDAFAIDGLAVQPLRHELLDRLLARPESSVSAQVRGFVISDKRLDLKWFLVFALVYLLVVGPLDFLVVRRCGNPRLTWVTFPIVVLIFCGLAWGMGRGRISMAEIRELTFVDFLQPDGKRAVCRSFIGAYSDTNQAYTFRPRSRGAEVDLLERDSGGQRAYIRSSSGEVLAQKMHIWSFHGYQVRWVESGFRLGAVLASDPGGPRLRVTYDLPQPAVAAFVFHEKEWYALQMPPASDGPIQHSVLLGDPVTEDDLARRLPGEFFHEQWLRASWRDQEFSSSTLVIVLPRPWQALEILERASAPQEGFCVVRCPVVIE